VPESTSQCSQRVKLILIDLREKGDGNLSFLGYSVDPADSLENSAR